MVLETENFFDSSKLLIKSRIEIIFGVTWAASLGSIIAGRGFPPITESLLSIIAAMMIVTSVYIYNDVIDREMDAYSDKEKKKARPIANGKVSPKNAMKFVYLTGALGIVMCLMLNLTVFIIGATYYALVFLYSYPRVRFKNRFILKNLVTSLLPPTSYLISGAAVENEISRTMAFVAFTYFSLTVLIQPAIADMLDYKEDKAFNVKTIGNVLSWKQNLILFNSGLVMLMASSILSFTVFGFNYIVPTITTILCTYLIIYSYKIRNENGESASYKLRPITYTILCLSPLVMAIGAFL